MKEQYGYVKKMPITHLICFDDVNDIQIMG